VDQKPRWAVIGQRACVSIQGSIQRSEIRGVSLVLECPTWEGCVRAVRQMDYQGRRCKLANLKKKKKKKKKIKKKKKKKKKKQTKRENY
jgi:hypothetical protein